MPFSGESDILEQNLVLGYIKPNSASHLSYLNTAEVDLLYSFMELLVVALNPETVNKS